MTKNIPYKYYKSTLVGVWAFALLCLVGTWLASFNSQPSAMVYAVIVDVFLTVILDLLAILLIISGRPDYKTKGWLVAALDIVHTGFFIAVLILGSKGLTSDSISALVVPIIHTLILLGIVGFGIYFSIRDRFVFKNPNEHDAIAAFGGPLEAGVDPTNAGQQGPVIPETPVQPEPPKPARDEKTGIVSL